MRHEDFRAALEAGDVRLCRKMWAAFMPHLPVPTPEEAEAVMHHARTGAETVSFKARAWSHRWLTERGLPSGLPDKLKPSAERIYPRVVDAVGISVNSRSPWLKPAMVEVRKSMEDAVSDCYANGDTAPAIVRPEMFKARERTMRQLFGRAG
jgi:hypothetical protein